MQGQPAILAVPCTQAGVLSSLMNLRQLEAFRTVIIAGSVTGAANMLKVSQPGVSRLIGGLERSIGFKLFIRHKGRLHPTPEGLSFFEELERSFVGMESLERAAQEIKALRRGHLRIAAMPAVCLDLLPRAVKDFLNEHPRLKITLEVHSSPRIVEWVAAQHFDIGVAQLTLEQPGIDVIHSFRTHCVCVAPAGHSFADKATIGPGDLEGEPCIALAPHTVAAMQIDPAFVEANVRRDIRIETLPSFAACSLVAQGLGVAIVDPLTAAFFAAGRIVARPFAPPIQFGFRIIRPSRGITSRAADLFIERARQSFVADRIVTAV